MLSSHAEWHPSSHARIPSGAGDDLGEAVSCRARLRARYILASEPDVLTAISPFVESGRLVVAVPNTLSISLYPDASFPATRSSTTDSCLDMDPVMGSSSRGATFSNRAVRRSSCRLDDVQDTVPV